MWGTRRAWVAVAVLMGVAAPVAAQTTTRVSVTSNGVEVNNDSNSPAISADGRFVAFESDATNLVAGDTNGFSDVFVRDRESNTTERVSLGPGGVQGSSVSALPSISADGRYVAFQSGATNLIANDTNNVNDIFVRDRQTGTTTRVSVANVGSQALGGASSFGRISADGRYVMFQSDASNLVSGDTNGQTDVFVRDRQAGSTVRVSISTNGTQGNGVSYVGEISADGKIATFYSQATTLVFGDGNGAEDVFVRDLQAGTTTRISVSPSKAPGDAESLLPSMSTDGRYTAFYSSSTNFDVSGGKGLYVYDHQSGAISTLTVVPQSTAFPAVPFSPSISGDGRWICYALGRTSTITDLWVIDRVSLTKARIGVAANGALPNATTGACSVNADGTAFAFHSEATNLVTGDSNSAMDVFLRTKPPTMSLDKTTMNFAAVSNGASFVWQTSAQIARLTQEGTAPITWSAGSSQSWLQVSPASGTGSAELTISVTPTAGLPASGTVTATIFVSLTGAGNTLPPIAVNLTLIPNGTSTVPFGAVDTPAGNLTGVTGALPVTGWALDDVEVTHVSICRAAFGSEVAPVDPNCGGATEIFVGFAVFIDGARPDVQAAFPSHPLSSRGGWGFMLLTNMLPSQGNGTYAFAMRARDREGHWFLLGTRTMTCANASATLPFGTIDTPLQGGVASGSSYVNFGWALTPQPKTIPIDGSTIQVLIDGVAVGNVDYNHPRSDIQALFPGFTNTNGAIGFRILNTAALINGLHTISWTVTDNAGAVEGIGSRFFTVSNSSSSALTAASTAVRAVASAAEAPLETSPVMGRRGWDLNAPLRLFATDANGVTVIRSEEVNRVELQLGDGDYSGYLRTPGGAAPLPIGSRLDRSTNTFTWAPGVGFVGAYDFAFVRSNDGRVVSRRDVRIILQPKSRGLIGPQVAIDLPIANAIVQQPFMLGGWAADLDAPVGTGVSTLHAWAYPTSGGAPIFLGATVSGGARPDVAVAHGNQFKESGFGLIVQGLPAGDYDLAVFAWSTETMGFVAPKVVRVSVTP